MTDNLTPGQLARWIDKHEELHNRLVEKAYHDLELGGLREDVNDIKESQKWAMRLIISLLVSNLIGLIYFVVAQNPGG